MTTTQHPCDGASALGRCDKRSKYRVDSRDACGLHLAQVVKSLLADRASVVVTEVGQ